MKRLVLLAGLFVCLTQGVAMADDNLSLPIGPLTFTVPLKTASLVYLYDFNAQRNLVGAETPFVSAWDKFEGTVGAVTSLDGNGSPFLGGNLIIGNVLAKYVTLPENFKIGGYGGYDVNSDSAIYGLKASTKIW